MKIPVIRVRDGLSEKEHIVGFDNNDRLYIDNNEIKYENTLSMSGTELNEYLFVGNEDSLSGDISVEMVSLEEYLDMIMAKLCVNSEKHKALAHAKEEYIRASELERESIEEAAMLLVNEGYI